MARSSFNGVAFDWAYAGPKRSVVDYVGHFSGDIFCYSEADFATLFGLQKAVTITPVSANNVFVDYWPPDPTHTLLMYIGAPTAETHQAILIKMDRNRKVSGNGTGLTLVPDGTIHFATADFLILS